MISKCELSTTLTCNRKFLLNLFASNKVLPLLLIFFFLLTRWMEWSSLSLADHTHWLRSHDEWQGKESHGLFINAGQCPDNRALPEPSVSQGCCLLPNCKQAWFDFTYTFGGVSVKYERLLFWEFFRSLPRFDTDFPSQAVLSCPYWLHTCIW